MKIRLLVALAALLSFTVACNTNPEVAKKKYVERGNAYFEKGKYKEAMIMYRNALKKDPKYGEAYYRAALTQMKMAEDLPTMKDKIVARLAVARDLHRAIEFQPDNMDANEKLINIYLETYLNLPERPKAIITELKTIEDRLAKRAPNSYQLVRLRGFLALTENKNKDAINYFQQANAMKPDEPDVVLILMNSLQQEKRTAEAEKLGLDLIVRNPKLGGIYDGLFMLYLRDGRVPDAEKILQRKLSALPNEPSNYLQLAAHYYASRKDLEMRTTIEKLTSDLKTFPDGYKQAGDFYLRVRDYPAAYRIYQQGVERDPKRKAMYQKVMCEALAQQGKYKEAYAIVDEVLKENPKDDEALGIRAALRLNAPTGRDDPQAALSDLQAVVTRVPGNAVMRYNLGRAYLARSNDQQARIQFEESIKLNPTYLQPRVALGEVLLKRGEYGRVVQIAGEIMAQDARNLPARLLRTRALIGSGDLRQARQELNGVIAEFPQVWEAKLQLAALDTVDNNHAAAQAVYREIIDKTHDMRAVVGLAESLLRQNKVDESFRVLQTEIDRSPNNPMLRTVLGGFALRAQRFDVAQAAFQQVTAQSPKDGDAWVRLAEAQRQSGQPDAALASLKKATEINPKNVMAILQTAMIYDNQGRRDASRPLYDQVLKVEPENPIALNNVAYALAEYGGDLDQALSMAQRARQHLPQHDDIADTLGLVYLKKNLNDTAIGIFRDIVRKQPNRATYRYHLGLALAAKGNKPEARKELETALRNNPQREEADKIKQAISKLG